MSLIQSDIQSDIQSKPTQRTYILRTRVDYKSPWIFRADSTDYNIISRMAKHYKSKGYITQIEVEDLNIQDSQGWWKFPTL